MKVNLIGLRELDFDNDKGEPVQGVKLFFSYPDDGVYGECTDQRFVGAKVFESFGISLKDLAEHIGEVIDIEINPRNKIVGLTL